MFIVDLNLGKLAATLRLLGFGTLFAAQISDHQIVLSAVSEKRIILTQDRVF